MSERSLLVGILAGLLILCSTALAGCWMVNVLPLKGRCATWQYGAFNGQYVLVPCELKSAEKR